MGLVENDPRNTGFIALYIAAKLWYTLIPSEVALRIANGKSHARPGNKLTPELREQIMKITENYNFKNFNSVERRFRINRYDIITSEGEFSVGQIENHLRQLKRIAQECNGECEKCILDMTVNDSLTMCEFICDSDLENPQKAENSKVRKSAKKCNVDLMAGETVKKGFQVYKKVSEEFDKFASSNKDKKIKDMVSRALLEYMERHK